MKDKGNTKKH